MPSQVRMKKLENSNAWFPRKLQDMRDRLKREKERERERERGSGRHPNSDFWFPISNFFTLFPILAPYIFRVHPKSNFWHPNDDLSPYFRFRHPKSMYPILDF